MDEIILGSEEVVIKPVLFVDESVKGLYTTNDLILKDESIEKLESVKVVLSNDTLALCQLLETMINVMRSK